MIKNNKKKEITLGLIAARKNSTEVRNKNLLKIDGIEITKRAVFLALLNKNINNIVFSSDSKKILSLIKKKNKKLLKLKRSFHLAKNTTPMLPVIKNAINFFEKNNKNNKVSEVVLFDPTSPLRTNADINKALKYFKKKKPDLLLSVHKAQHNPYFSMVEKRGNFYSLSKNLNKNPGSRQSVKSVFEINTIVWIYSRNAIFQEKKRIPKKTLIFETPYERSIDIDNYNDIIKINNYLKNKK